MTRYLRHLFAAVVLAAWAAFAAHGAPPEGDPPPADILAALTEEMVQIRSNFAGAEITLYGAVRGFEEGDDIAIAVETRVYAEPDADSSPNALVSLIDVIFTGGHIHLRFPGAADDAAAMLVDIRNRIGPELLRGRLETPGMGGWPG